ncbi:2-keto-3-deoxy-phosphogluconate aldolase [Alkalibaculum bacchi]|uniref:2-keto-3-deoxy-phosphogluconate aldolase n=1 Tax=Alkalibaculum bacchi TaxID=645887 RepID=A0A366IAJ1_9FIRM|nr:bifunctional 2-keto-4-hydroxyglutarate aldolase/2-keto-3-deoxy-6-phosphogluconate aldolase [Alkalibaculum bacchi]RBP67327.1 2-keto-3-deoxy-phosphogluconate aldolase [Alkalibaculum bacchi]
MNKAELMVKLKEEKLVAVIRGSNEEEVIKTVEAVYKGGIKFIELTFTVPNAPKVIESLVSKFKGEDIVIGAGTCMDLVSARLAILAGAQFVVSPHLDEEIIKLCNSYCIPVFPGATTVKDMVACLSLGASVIKLFPGDIFGPKAIKAFKGPLPQAEFMPTGGVSLDNVREWLDHGAYAVGVGSVLTKGAKTGDFKQVEEDARKFVEAVK